MKLAFAAVVIATANSVIALPAPNGTNDRDFSKVETSHAAPSTADFLRGLFAAKTANNGDKELQYYNPKQAAYYDSTIGLTIAANRSQFEQRFGGVGKPNPPGVGSFPLRILGDSTGGAVVYFVDTPELYLNEIRSLTSFDFINGTIIRQLDNWDGRGNKFKATEAGDPQYPSFGLATLKETATANMQTIAKQLNDAFSSGNATAAALLFSYNAVYEDLTLRARVEGQIAISAYLQRIISGLPYGPGTKITHILGNSCGGGYEWRPCGNGVLYGLNALELDSNGYISRFTSAWDGSRLSQAAVQGLARLAPTP